MIGKLRRNRTGLDMRCEEIVTALQNKTIMDIAREEGNQITPVAWWCQLFTVGSRTFNISGPRIWNGLPEDVVSALTFSSFRRRLKPFLFQQLYPDLTVHLRLFWFL